MGFYRGFYGGVAGQFKAFRDTRENRMEKKMDMDMGISSDHINLPCILENNNLPCVHPKFHRGMM